MGALKKRDCLTEKNEMKKDSVPANSHPDSAMAKAEIERMKKLLNEKIKDPNLAKKAALIISEMLKK
jgi:hypothetical protein